MKIHPYILVMLFLCPFMATSQKKLTIEDASGMNRSLFPSSLRNLQWIGSSDYLCYTEKDFILKRGVNSSEIDTLIKLSTLNGILKSAGMDSLSRIPALKWPDETSFRFVQNNKIYKVSLQDQLVTAINSYPEDAENIDLHEEGEILAYTVKNNLFIAKSGDQIQVTSDDDPGIINGQTVHRNEFGIDKGTFWSPSGKYLAFYRKDETMVTDYPLVDISSRIAIEEKFKYPMAGMTSEQVKLVIYNLEDGSSRVIKTGEPADQYLTSITWGPDSKNVYIGVLNREQNHLRLNCYDIKTGELNRTLFEEKNDKYVEPEHPLYFLDSDPNLFIWFSERDGYQHLYLYDIKGTLIRQLTKGPWVVTRYLGTEPDGTIAYFLSTINSPLNEDLFSVNLKNSKIQSLSLNTGTHDPIIHRNGKYFLDVFSDTLVSREYSVIDNKGRVQQFLHRSDDPLDHYQQCKINIFRLQNEDGTELHCRMILPSEFNPEKKYPAIVYVYGGPHAQLVNNSWLGGASLFLYYLAQQGYVVFTLDNRGSANRGLGFEQAVFRNLGTLEVSDQMAGVNFLQKLPYVDPERIGVHGWSYGGYMTISLMLDQPGVFKAGVCGGPVTDWKYYEVMYGERYMDTPEENQDGYEASSLLNKAGKLKGELLVIHGTSDPVVVWQHSLALMKRFIEENVQADYFVYPGHGHGVGGKDRVHLNRKIEKFFNDHL